MTPRFSNCRDREVDDGHFNSLARSTKTSIFGCLPCGEASEYPDGQDDEKSPHAGASVAGSQRSRDDVVAFKRDGQNSQDGGVGNRQFDERHQFT